MARHPPGTREMLGSSPRGSSIPERSYGLTPAFQAGPSGFDSRLRVQGAVAKWKGGRLQSGSSSVRFRPAPLSCFDAAVPVRVSTPATVSGLCGFDSRQPLRQSLPIVKWTSRWSTEPQFEVRILVGRPCTHSPSGRTRGSGLRDRGSSPRGCAVAAWGSSIPPGP